MQDEINTFFSGECYNIIFQIKVRNKHYVPDYNMITIFYADSNAACLYTSLH